jgi:hypothetical protein
MYKSTSTLLVILFFFTSPLSEARRNRNRIGILGRNKPQAHVFKPKKTKKEKIGKTHLRPWHQIKVMPPFPVGFKTLRFDAEADVQYLHIDRINKWGSFLVAHIFDQQGERYQLAFDTDEVESLSFVRELPLLRGRLHDVFSENERSLYSRLHLRINFNQTKTIKSGDKRKKIKELIYSIQFRPYKTEMIEKVFSKGKDIREIYRKNKLHPQFALQTLQSLLHRGNLANRQFTQFKLKLNSTQRAEFITELLELGKYYSGRPKKIKKFVNNEYTSSTIFFRKLDHVLKATRGHISATFSPIRLRGGRARDRRKENEFLAKKSSLNPYLISKSLAYRGLIGQLYEWRFFDLKDELCVRFPEIAKKGQCLQALGLTTIKKLVKKKWSPTLWTDMEGKLKLITNRDISNFPDFLAAQDLIKNQYRYIHKGLEVPLWKFIYSKLAVDNTLMMTKEGVLSSSWPMKIKKQVSNLIDDLRMTYWTTFLNSLDSSKEYEIFRFYEEGDHHKFVGRFFVSRLLAGLKHYVSAHHERLRSSRYEELGRFNRNTANELFKKYILAARIAERIDSSEKERLERLISKKVKNGNIDQIMQDYIDTDLEHMGNRVGSKIVNVLGQIFKKRKWVPYLRFTTMFRKNHLTQYRDRVFKQLFSKNGMRPGDIILEKDLKANTDVIIPGYWVHAAMYVGTIKQLKMMGIWDHPDFNMIQYEIEKYRKSPARQKYLKDTLRVKESFENIPWFYESDRPGVGVHPMHKFAQTDGMAVLRPSGKWTTPNIVNILKRANRYMYFPYDYVHNVRNQFYVSCSKVVLKIFDQVTFPVSNSLAYISVSPDQIGQPVSLDPNRPEQGDLKLIFYFDPENKGKLIYDHRRPKTGDNLKAYHHYLKSSGVKF